uniref:Uncharacterized protein n=1 Tax=Tanacetum cinerariifolium TaxID=118510 RepID=A0A6L2LGG6_TANCI|nr:hypothetical protein [Tanacetum cinerariifolium]
MTTQFLIDGLPDSTNWSHFINRSGYGDISTLHFIWEGADTFYVTGYDEHGGEIGGYNDLMRRQRRSRILVTLGNDPGESLDEEAVFYQTLSRHVKNEGNLAIPPDFVIANDLFIFEHAKIVYGKKSYRLELHQEFYNDDPSRVNDMKLVGNWGRILHRCMLGKNKTIHIKIYHCAEIEWYDLDDSETFSINGYDAMLEDLDIKDGSILFSHFRIPRKSLDEGLGVVIKEVVEDNEVKEASEIGHSGKQLLSVTENDVQTKTEPSTPPWSFESLSDFDISNHPSWSSESMNKKRNKRLSEEFQFRKILFDIDLTFGLDFSHETLEMKIKDPYHGEDEAEENAELFDEQDHLLKHVPFLKETVVIVDGDAPLLAVDALVVPLVIVLNEQLERPNKRRKLNPA